MFLPRHRYYVQYFEDALAKTCGYRGMAPYWDWTLGTVSVVVHSGDPSVMTGLVVTILVYNSDFFGGSPFCVGASIIKISASAFKGLNCGHALLFFLGQHILTLIPTEPCSCNVNTEGRTRYEQREVSSTLDRSTQRPSDRTW